MSNTALEKHESYITKEFQIDISSIVKYQEKCKDLVSVDVMSAPLYMRDFNHAYLLTASLISQIQVAYDKAVLDAKHEAAKAKLERAIEYFKKNNILNGALKDSGALRDTYVDMDELYIRAKEKVSMLEALLTYLNNLLNSFKMAHDDVKKIYDKSTGSPDYLSNYGGLPSGKTNLNLKDK